jgi:4-amino-4-deoxy-L-arabinose transferase-like glycosyltransferase
MMSLCGLNEITIAGYPFVLSIAGLVLAYLFGRLLFGPLAGLLTCFFASLVPIDLTMSSLLLPDLVAAFWGNLGLCVVLFSLRYEKPVRHLLFLAGVLFGVSWLCKESVAFLAPFCLFLVIAQSRGPQWRHAILPGACILAGAALILFGESMVFLLRTNDAFFHFHETERNYQVCKEWFFDKDSPIFGWQEGGYYRAIFQRLFVDGPRALLLNTDSFGPVPLIALVSMAFSPIFNRSKAFYLSSFWFLSVIFLFNFCSSSLHSYKPLPLFDRYLYPMVLPGVVVVGGFVSALMRTHDATSCNSPSEGVGRLRVFSGLLIIFYIVMTQAPNLRWRIQQSTEYTSRVAVRYLKSNDIIFANHGKVSSLVFFRSGQLLPDGGTRPYEEMHESDFSSGAYVLVDKEETIRLERAYQYKRPPFEDTPPYNWENVWCRGGATLYRVGVGTNSDSGQGRPRLGNP